MVYSGTSSPDFLSWMVGGMLVASWCH